MGAPLDRPFTDEVLRRARKGKRRALEQMWTVWNPPLLRFFAARNAPDPEDLAQQVWLEVATKLPEFEGDAKAFRRWLFTLAHRRLIDGARRQATRPSQPSSHEPGRLERASVDPGEGRVDDLDWALQMVSRLPDTQATVVLLRTVVGLDTDEVAEIVGKSAGAVRVLHHRATSRLKELIEAETAVSPVQSTQDENSEENLPAGVTPHGASALTGSQ